MWIDDWVLAKSQQDWPIVAASDAKSYPFLSRFFPIIGPPFVVLANSNDPLVEVNQERCDADGVSVLRRKGGGGAVVLSPGCAVWTLGFYARHLYENTFYFQFINTFLCRILSELGVQNLRQKGISDICIGDKKIVGTSLFRRKHLLLYQASVLIHPNLEQIGCYLNHPSKEPDYRQGRAHRDFITSLRQEGSLLSSQVFVDFANHYVERHFVDLAVQQEVFL